MLKRLQPDPDEELESKLMREMPGDLIDPAWRGVTRLLQVRGAPRSAAASGSQLETADVDHPKVQEVQATTPRRALRLIGRLQVEVLEGADSLPGLREEWTDLYRRVGTEPSTSYDWTAAVVAHRLRPFDRVRIVVFRRYGQVVGLVPLLARPFWHEQGFRHLVPLAEDQQTHSDWLFAERSPAMADALVVALTVYSGTLRSRVLEVLERARNHGAEQTLTFVDPRMDPPPRVLRPDEQTSQETTMNWRARA